jgi:Tfp pilus assembly protein PilO
MLIHILIVFFVLLMGYQLYLEMKLAIKPNDSLIEGLETQNQNQTQEYKPYNTSDPNNALILAQQNAGNIEVLKGRVDKLDGVKERIDGMEQSMNSMQTQIDNLVQQQADYAQDMAGSEPVTITGTDEETTEDVEESISKK